MSLNISLPAIFLLFKPFITFLSLSLYPEYTYMSLYNILCIALHWYLCLYAHISLYLYYILKVSAGNVSLYIFFIALLKCQLEMYHFIYSIYSIALLKVSVWIVSLYIYRIALLKVSVGIVSLYIICIALLKCHLEMYHFIYTYLLSLFICIALLKVSVLLYIHIHRTVESCSMYNV